MTRKLIIALALMSGLVWFAGCGGPKYGDVLEVNGQFVKAMEDYLAQLEKADAAEKVAAAINSFADSMEKIAPRMKELSDKYPELRNPENVPEEMKASMKETEEVSKRFGASFMKMMQFMKDPEVRAAQERLGKAMQTMK